jgi:hypothetical protein
VILRGFAVYVGLIPSRPEDKGWRGAVLPNSAASAIRHVLHYAITGNWSHMLPRSADLVDDGT